MNVVLCEYAEKRKFTAGNKARTDTVEILKNNGFLHIPLYRSKDNKVKIVAEILHGCNKSLKSVKENELIFLQYPYYPSAVNYFIISLINKRKQKIKFKTLLLIHDMVSLRESDIDSKEIVKEIEYFNKFDFIISHNATMRDVLINNGCISNIVVLGPFDYLYTGNINKFNRAKTPCVIIAGNLDKNKCGYVYKLDKIKNVNFNLYGINYSGCESGNVKYNGSYPPEELISKLNGNYGLVWDGDSIDTCEGKYGNYLRFNNPHKFSLYIAAGIPVIVWKKSALAKYVIEYNLGICIDSLKDLENYKINDDEYTEMIKSVSKYRDRIIKGQNLSDCIKQIIRMN